MIHGASPPLVDEWPTCLNRSMEETLLALDGEKMYVGSSHREQRAGSPYRARAAVMRNTPRARPISGIFNTGMPA